MKAEVVQEVEIVKLAQQIKRERAAQYSTVQCGVVQCSAVHYGRVQKSAVRYLEHRVDVRLVPSTDLGRVDLCTYIQGQVRYDVKTSIEQRCRERTYRHISHAHTHTEV